MLPKLCHLDNDLEIIIIQYIYCVVHMTYIPCRYLWTFVSHGAPVWPRPVIKLRGQGGGLGLWATTSIEINATLTLTPWVR